jgi:hypothetical protein
MLGEMLFRPSRTVPGYGYPGTVQPTDFCLVEMDRTRTVLSVYGTVYVLYMCIKYFITYCNTCTVIRYLLLLNINIE